MKRIQVMMDPALLGELDGTEEARREGRSSVLRRTLPEYLEQNRRVAIRERYQAAYGGGEGLGEDFEGWEEEGSWPHGRHRTPAHGDGGADHDGDSRRPERRWLSGSTRA
jgi:hypothetical protein